MKISCQKLPSCLGTQNENMIDVTSGGIYFLAFGMLAVIVYDPIRRNAFLN